MNVSGKNKKNSALAILLLAALSAMTPAQADDAPARELTWIAAVGGDVRWFDWREHQDEKQLLMETGPLAAVAGQVQLQYGPAFTRIDVQAGGGLARYDGHLQSGPAYAADAWEEVTESEWRMGWQDGSDNVHAGFMQRDWRRHIDGSVSVSSAEERYRWRLLVLGGEYQTGFFRHWQMGLAVNVGKPIDSYQKVYGSFYDGFSLQPGNGLYWRFAVPLRERGDHPGFSVEPYYQQQGMQRSNSAVLMRNGVPQSTLAYQPASIRRELGVTVLWYFAGSAKAGH